jgi:hypothetical protein
VDFPLAELDPHDGPGRSFIEGTIVNGHFERGATPNVTNAVAKVLQVMHSGSGSSVSPSRMLS